MPVPDCSVVTHSDILVAPTTLTLEVAPKESNEEMDSVCDDPHLIKKVCLYLRDHLYITSDAGMNTGPSQLAPPVFG